MQGGEGDTGFWQWLLSGGFWAVITGAASVAGSMVVGAWVARGTLAKIEQKSALHDQRLSILENDRASLLKMASDVAVLAALQAEMRADIQAIFERCNRRFDDQHHEPERRKHDKDSSERSS